VTITVVIPVSPIKSHPDTAILDETLDSVRYHHPTAEIILTFDGIREEQSRRWHDYEEFIRRALWRADTTTAASAHSSTKNTATNPA
jgi:hypothetical protein